MGVGRMRFLEEGLYFANFVYTNLLDHLEPQHSLFHLSDSMTGCIVRPVLSQELKDLFRTSFMALGMLFKFYV